MGKLDVILLI